MAWEGIPKRRRKPFPAHAGSCKVIFWEKTADEKKTDTFCQKILENILVNLCLLYTSELDEMADKLEKAGMADAAKQIREGVSDFQKGNMRLSLALTLVKEHLKEVK